MVVQDAGTYSVSCSWWDDPNNRELKDQRQVGSFYRCGEEAGAAF